MLGLALFVLSLTVLHRYLSTLNFREFLFAVRNTNRLRIAAAIVLTVADYVILTGYDALALRHLRIKLAYWRIALTSFLCYSIGHNIGLSLLSGGSIRMRLYSTWGIHLRPITQIIAVAIVTYWVGFLTLSVVVFPLLPRHALRVFPYIRPLGWISLALLAAYFAWNLIAKRSLIICGWEFPPLARRYTLAQILLSTIEILCAASVLYTLLAPVIVLSFPAFVGIFLLAQLSGLASQVPGGIGVFESVILLAISRHAPIRDVFAALLLYRLIYYIIPLVTAIALLGVHEFLQQRLRNGKK